MMSNLESIQEKHMCKISKYVEKTADGKYIGLIYKRTLVKEDCPDNGKVYVGATTDPKGRDSNWRKKNSHTYGGKKITEARTLYPDLDNWASEYIETVEAETPEELSKLLEEREDYWINELDAIENGFNTYTNKNRVFTPEHCANISQHHQNNLTAETRAKISLSLKGRKLSDETKKKISKANSGKQRTPEQKAAQSERMKGHEPVAASEGLKKFIEEHGHGPTLGIKLSDEARAHMKAAKQKSGIDTIATYPDGSEVEYPTMLDAAKATGHNVGSVSNNIKSGGITMKGYKFRKA